MAITQAPDSDTLHAFEDIFEEAALTIIDEAGIDALKARSAENRPLFDVAVSFTVGGADEVRLPRISTSDGNPLRQEYYSYKGCKLEVQIAYNRALDPGGDVADADSKFGSVRAKLRNLFRQCKWPFRDENLKYYRVTKLRPDGTQNGTDDTKQRDICTLSWDVDFVIPPEAWPAED
jgi:hypothetical protein